MKKILLIIMIITIAISLFAQNPFTSGKGKQTEAGTKSQVWLKTVQIQKDLNTTLTKNLKIMKEEFNLKIFLILLAIGFLYGVVHAIGPGHGKMLVGAYFLQNDASILSSIKIGSIISITHSGSAAILGILFGMFLKSFGMYKYDIQNYIGIISGGLIALLGITYLFINLLKKGHVHQILSNKNEIVLGIFSGMVPCPVSLTIILFSIYLQMLWLGIVTVIALSLGMAVTISFIGIIMIKSRGLVGKLTHKNSKRAEIMQKILAVSGSLIIILIGVSLVLSKI
ncbi:MAG: hypothetical protein KAS49_02465 [Candidatus Cloacimonetes bacterium]|nr:hypothetical protein [Candidatus Cloacimonadota bacterium]